MTLLNNPFVTSGYIAPEYFCDRKRETEELSRWLINENNVAIISTRRMGKTGLIRHCFNWMKSSIIWLCQTNLVLLLSMSFNRLLYYPEKNTEALYLRTYVNIATRLISYLPGRSVI